MSPGGSPPRLARWLVGRALPAERRDDILGDLEELYAERVAARGRPYAAAWYAFQAMAFAMRFSAERLRRPGTPNRRALSSGPPLRHALRRLRRRPGFSGAVVLTLTLGIGANAAVFQVIEAVRLRTLPVAAPDDLVILELVDNSRWQGRRTSGFPVLSNPLWEAVRDGNGPLESPVAWAAGDLRLESPAGSERVRALFVSGGFFARLGVTPERGRMLGLADDVRGCAAPGVVLSATYWARVFGGDPSTVGRVLHVEGQALPVVGVAKSGFTGIDMDRGFDVAVPICARAVLGGAGTLLDDGMTWWLTVLARLPEGTTLEAANARLSPWSGSVFDATLPPEYPAGRADDYRSLRLQALPAATGVSSLRSRYGEALDALLAITLLVLALACTNLVSLFLARGSTRRTEFDVRRALGASRGGVIRELVAESAILSCAGALGGVGFAALTSGVLVRYLGGDAGLDVSMGPLTMGFVLAVTLVATLLFGLVPAWPLAWTSPGASQVTRVGRGVAGGQVGARLRNVLVVSQVSLSFVLVFSAFLFTAVLRDLLAVDAGFDAEGVTIARVDFGASAEGSVTRGVLDTELLRMLNDLPGVDAAAEVRHVPLGGTGSSVTVRLDGASEEGVTVRANAFTARYLEAMGMRILAGRGFREDEGRRASSAIVNPAFLALLGLPRAALGIKLRIEGSAEAFEIVGIVQDSKHFSLREAPLPLVFVPKDRLPDSRTYADFVIRSPREPRQVQEAVRAAVAALAPELWLDMHLLRDDVRTDLVRERLLSTLSSFLGVLATMVAAVGLYGVLSYWVTQRRGELGTRIALGADRRRVWGLVFMGGGRLAGTGLLIGAGLSLFAARTMGSVLAGAEVHRLAAVLASGALLGLVAVVAISLPARRAAATEPMEALRSD